MGTISFAEAIIGLNDDDIVYSVEVDDVGWGDLMTYVCYMDSVTSGGFIDYDGHGDALDADGKFIGSIRPSAGDKYPEAMYVLWYNR